jgi:hypothetical protein
MIKTICNKCGKELKEDDNEVLLTKARNTRFGIDERCNLCDKHYKELVDWMKKDG